MSTVIYHAKDNKAELDLDNGATIQASRIRRGREQELWAYLYITSPSGDLGAAQVCISDPRGRWSLCQRLSGKNGLRSRQWEAELTAFYIGLEEVLDQVKERIGIEDEHLVDISTRGEPGPREYTVARLIPRGKITSIFADGGLGKGYVALTLVQCVATGGKFLAELQCQKVDVLYLDWEDDEEEFTRRSYEVARGLGLSSPPQGLFYRRLTQPLGDAFDGILQIVEERGIGLVVIDSFGAACAGEAERSRDAIATMQLLQRLPSTVLVIDHEPKPGRDRGPSQFGSIYKRNLSRSQMRLEDCGSPEPGRRAILLRHTKLNIGPLTGAWPLYLVFDADQVYLVKGDPDDEAFKQAAGSGARILEAIERLGQATVSEIAGEVGLKTSEKTIQNHITQLRKQNKVTVVGKKGKAAIYALAGTKPRQTHCWQCQTDLSGDVDEKCPSCGWLVCPNCGACQKGGCNP